jgi:hypothetical protein
MTEGDLGMDSDQPDIPAGDRVAIVGRHKEIAGLGLSRVPRRPRPSGSGGTPVNTQDNRHLIVEAIDSRIFVITLKSWAAGFVMFVIIVFGMSYVGDTPVRREINPAAGNLIRDALSNIQTLDSRFASYATAMKGAADIAKSDTLAESIKLIDEINVKLKFHITPTQSVARNVAAVKEKVRQAVGGANNALTNDEWARFSERAGEILERDRGDQKQAATQTEVMAVIEDARRASDEAKARIHDFSRYGAAAADVGITGLLLVVIATLGSLLRSLRSERAKLWEKRVAVQFHDDVPWKEVAVAAGAMGLSGADATDPVRMAGLDALLGGKSPS